MIWVHPKSRVMISIEFKEVYIMASVRLAPLLKSNCLPIFFVKDILQLVADGLNCVTGLKSEPKTRSHLPLPVAS